MNDPHVQREIELLTTLYVPQFDRSASLFLFELYTNPISFIVSLLSEDWGEVAQFTMMAEMGFFCVTGQRYQMAVPAQLNSDIVRSAVLKYAHTEDDEFCLHPEYLLVTMPFGEAAEW